MVELHTIAKYCNFCSPSDAMIGMWNPIQIRLLLAERDKIMLPKALFLAQAYETTLRDATTLLPKDASSPINSLEGSSSLKQEENRVHTWCLHVME